jgi:Fungalysin metallopeptidase (M36)/Fungalysin/Thermolysin Propeptide Motif
MSGFTNSLNTRSVISVFIGLLLFTAIIILPTQFSTKAIVKNDESKTANPQTKSEDLSLPYYDIRTDKQAEAVESLSRFRSQANKNAVQIADLRENFVLGEKSLRQKVPTLVTEYNGDIQIPEVITPDVKQRIAFLTSPSSEKRSEILRNFIKQNKNLVGVTDSQASSLKVTQDYTNPNGELSFAMLEQFINGVPVFRGEVKAGFTRNGEIIRVINNLAPNLDYSNLSTDFGSPNDAVIAAAKFINHELKPEETVKNAKESTNLKVVFGEGDWATTAEKMYFPTEPSVARTAWRVLIWQPTNAFYVIVDAETGEMLWRKNITNDQTQPATYNVYANGSSMINTADSPAPATPGPLDPTLGTQFPIIPRTNITLIGNESPNAFNNTGWIPDGGTDTAGNAVEAGLDIDGTNGVDANGRAVSATRNFSFNFSPADANGIGDAPTLAEFRNGAVTQLFYTCNRYHDELYRLGFNEQARNFQNTNYTGQGVAADRVSAEAQDSSGTNNANFSTPADGVRGRMQMYVFTAPNPDRDGDLDADIVIHEHTHGLSNRLHGNASGLGSTMSGGMGEGWSDFYAHSMLSAPTDPINGIYSTGGYTTMNFRIAPPFSNLGNYYYGIRAFPKAVLAFTGGPNNRPHNPLTFKDIEAPTVNDGAFPPAFSPSTNSTHYLGEVWSSNLWEVRAKFIARLGAEAGNRRVLQFVTDGMKLAPLNPNFIQERDAILAVARNSSLSPENSLDVKDVWSGFAVRGMGFSAGYTSAVTVNEAFDLPNVVQTPTFTFTDTSGNNNGFADPGETIMLNIPVSNNTGQDSFNTSLVVVGGGIGNYGTILDGITTTRQIPYSIPFTQGCGTAITLTFNIFSSLGNRSETRILSIGQGLGTTETFDTGTTLPTSWTSSLTGTGLGWAVSTVNPATAPNSIFANDGTAVGSSTVETNTTAINAPAAKVKFKINYNTESSWDGVVLEYKIGAGAYQDITNGGSFIAGGYNGFLNNGTFPNAGRNAWSGNSGGYVDVEAILPAAANGQNVQFRFVAGSDTAVGGVGTFIDNFRVENNFACSAIAAKSRADFDGDGKTDLSVFRPSEGNWYLNRSTAGFTAVNWGIATDVLTPADYDGDNKTDFAIFRATAADGSPDFYILKSSDFTVTGAAWGTTNDIPVVADYDGDSKADMAIYRPSVTAWYILKSSGGNQFTTFGTSSDKPVTGDFDGDGKADLTVFSFGRWSSRLSGSGSVSNVDFGLSDDKLVPADYDGDKRDDIAVYRPSTGVWYLRRSSLGLQILTFGIATDIPVPGDYDGDGKNDIGVYRNGIWYLLQSTSGVSIASFGLAGDRPIPKQYIP